MIENTQIGTYSKLIPINYVVLKCQTRANKVFNKIMTEHSKTNLILTRQNQIRTNVNFSVINAKYN